MTKIAIALAALVLAGAWDTPPPAPQYNAAATASASVRAHQAQQQAASAVSQGGAASVSYAGGSVAGRAPDVVLPSFGGGGMDCPTVGFGAAGSGLGGGGGFGPSWISSDCNKRKIAELLYRVVGQDAARQYIFQNIDGAAAAMNVAHPVPVVSRWPAWCVASDGRVLSNHAECR